MCSVLGFQAYCNLGFDQTESGLILQIRLLRINEYLTHLYMIRSWLPTRLYLCHNANYTTTAILYYTVDIYSNAILLRLLSYEKLSWWCAILGANCLTLGLWESVMWSSDGEVWVSMRYGTKWFIHNIIRTKFSSQRMKYHWLSFVRLIWASFTMLSMGKRVPSWCLYTHLFPNNKWHYEAFKLKYISIDLAKKFWKECISL